MPMLIKEKNALTVLLPRIAAIAQEKGRAIIAIDGMAASGKSTLAQALMRALDRAHLVHMDDFFLPEAIRTHVRDRLLANADVERFDAEVLAPLCAGQGVRYRPFVCHPRPRLLDPVAIPADVRIVIVEGAYCLHPLLAARYDLRILMTIGASTQRARILARNGEAMLARFENEWIPLENRHIRTRGLSALCDVRIHTP